MDKFRHLILEDLAAKALLTFDWRSILHGTLQASGSRVGNKTPTHVRVDCSRCKMNG